MLAVVLADAFSAFAISLNSVVILGLEELPVAVTFNTVVLSTVGRLASVASNQGVEYQ